MLLANIIFIIIAAFSIAKLEIQIEGKDGWAKNLPTWRVNNKLTQHFIGTYPFTGYHLWAGITFLIFMHLPIFVGLPWSISIELTIITMLLIITPLEDFLWFVMNPAFGVKKFNSKNVPWHRWIGPIPMPYLVILILATSCAIINYFLA